MPDHKVKLSTSRERRPWRNWNDYPNPTRDAILALLGIVVLVIVFGHCDESWRMVPKDLRRKNVCPATARSSLLI